MCYCPPGIPVGGLGGGASSRPVSWLDMPRRCQYLVTFMQNLKFKARKTIKSSVIHHQKAIIMHNLNQVLGIKFDN